MWTEVTIGKGNAGCSAVKVFELAPESNTYNVSENKVSYWVTDRIFGIRATIFKNSIGGAFLEKLINVELKAGGMTVEEILGWIDDLVISKASVSILKEKMSQKCSEAFKSGAEARGYAIERALRGDFDEVKEQYD